MKICKDLHAGHVMRYWSKIDTV